LLLEAQPVIASKHWHQTHHWHWCKLARSCPRWIKCVLVSMAPKYVALVWYWFVATGTNSLLPQNKLDGQDKRLIYEGAMNKATPQGTLEPRYLILLNDSLIWCKPKAQKKNRYQFKGTCTTPVCQYVVSVSLTVAHCMLVVDVRFGKFTLFDRSRCAR
jgi:hypothetical protein